MVSHQFWFLLKQMLSFPQRPVQILTQIFRFWSVDHSYLLWKVTRKSKSGLGNLDSHKGTKSLLENATYLQIRNDDKAFF